MSPRIRTSRAVSRGLHVVSFAPRSDIATVAADVKMAAQFRLERTLAAASEDLLQQMFDAGRSFEAFPLSEAQLTQLPPKLIHAIAEKSFKISREQRDQLSHRGAELEKREAELEEAQTELHKLRRTLRKVRAEKKEANARAAEAEDKLAELQELQLQQQPEGDAPLPSEDA